MRFEKAKKKKDTCGYKNQEMLLSKPIHEICMAFDVNNMGSVVLALSKTLEDTQIFLQTREMVDTFALKEQWTSSWINFFMMSTVSLHSR